MQSCPRNITVNLMTEEISVRDIVVRMRSVHLSALLMTLIPRRWHAVTVRFRDSMEQVENSY